jgi:hypothetical protein
MSSTPRFRVIGLAAGLAVVALAAGFFLLSGGQPSSSAATHTVIPLSKRPHAKGNKATHKNKPAVEKPAVRKPAVAKPAPAKPAATQNGLPAALAASLARNQVVVVALYAPSVELDDMAMREARAGAAAAGVGFVALNVLNEAQASPLTKQLGVLEDPGVLIYRRPGELVVRFTGYTDKEIVFQAARNTGL